MALYAGLPPQEALARWFQLQQQMQGLTPQEQYQRFGDVAGSMEALARENPEAFRLRAQGTAPENGQRQVFNQGTGNWDTQETHGWFSHPESWLQLGLGAAGGIGAATALSGAAGGAGAASGAAPAASSAVAPAAAAGGVLPSTTIGTGYIPAITGGTGITGGAGGAVTGGSILSKLGGTQGLLKNAGMMGQAVSNASSAAGNTRRADIDTNVGAQSAYNQALLSRAALEQKQRDAALRDVYAAGYFRDQPRSPYNPAPRQGVSQNYLAALGGLEGQAMQRLQQAPQYGTNQMAALNPYATRPSIGERIGNWAGPALSIAGAMGGQSPYQQYPGTPPYFPKRYEGGF